jgi:PAS domain S-box-containing protein
MLSPETIGAVFAQSNTPHLVLAAEASFPVISANQTFCDWVDADQEELSRLTSFPAALIGHILSISASHLIQLVEEVVATKTAFKRKVEPKERVTKQLPIKEGCVLEIYPILDTAVVIRVQPLAAIQPMPAVRPNPEVTSHIDYRLLPLILDSLANVIFLLEVEAEDTYRFSFVNKAFQVTTGVPIHKVEGSLVDEVIPEPSLTLVKGKYAEAIKTGQQVSWQEVSEYPTGKKTAEVAVVPVFNAKGKCERLIGMVHDITAFKTVEEQQERLSQELSRQNQDLHQFNYIVSHNLRAPVANVLGLSKLLTEKPKDSKEFDVGLQYLHKSVKRMDEVLMDLTNILSIRDGKDIIVKREIPLQEVFEQAMYDLRDSLEQSGAKVECDLEPETKVQGYRAYLHSVFYNLLSNSIKYRSQDRPLMISVKAEKDPRQCVKVTVSDNGTGFDARKVHDQVFRLYKRFHPDSVGKGVGLFMVKTQVEAMGGKIKVDSALDQGTTFEILLVKNN